MAESDRVTPSVPPGGEDDPWKDVQQRYQEMNAYPNSMVGRLWRAVEAALAKTREQHAAQLAEKDQAWEELADTNRKNFDIACSREAALRAELAAVEARHQEEIAVLTKERDELWGANHLNANALRLARAELTTLRKQLAAVQGETPAPQEPSECPMNGECLCSISTRHHWFIAMCEARDENTTLRAELARVQAENEGLERQIVKMQNDLMADRAALAQCQQERERFKNLLHELTTLVRGECPALLDEDRDGDARLSLDIDAALSTPQEDK